MGTTLLKIPLQYLFEFHFQPSNKLNYKQTEKYQVLLKSLKYVKSSKLYPRNFKISKPSFAKAFKPYFSRINFWQFEAN